MAYMFNEVGWRRGFREVAYESLTTLGKASGGSRITRNGTATLMLFPEQEINKKYIGFKGL